jgi:hypothetical protein
MFLSLSRCVPPISWRSAVATSARQWTGEASLPSSHYLLLVRSAQLVSSTP